MDSLIKDLAYCERPYEKAVLRGIESLSDAELIAVILRSGTSKTSSITLANQILDAHIVHKGILGMNYLRREDYLNINGIGNIKATQLLAVTELSRRMNMTRLKDNLVFSNPLSIANYYMEKCKYYTKEKVFVMLFSGAYTLIKELMLSEGIVNQAMISTRNIFIEALKYEAVHMILIHNHPSGIPEPSIADIEITKKIVEAGKLLDIILSDHIIIGNGTYVSLMERGILNEIR